MKRLLKLVQGLSLSRAQPPLNKPSNKKAVVLLPLFESEIEFFFNSYG
jgi:hypothetical protein